MDCFNNCKLLCDKIKNEDFTKEDIIEIGDFYNDNCKQFELLFKQYGSFILQNVKTIVFISDIVVSKNI